MSSPPSKQQQYENINAKRRKGDTTPQVIYEESPSINYSSGRLGPSTLETGGGPTTKRVYKNIQPALDEQSDETGSVFSSRQHLPKHYNPYQGSKGSSPTKNPDFHDV